HRSRSGPGEGRLFRCSAAPGGSERSSWSTALEKHEREVLVVACSGDEMAIEPATVDCQRGEPRRALGRVIMHVDGIAARDQVGGGVVGCRVAAPALVLAEVRLPLAAFVLG